MKKREVIFFLLLLTIVFYSVNLVRSDNGGFGISFEIVDTSGPLIDIISPINNSGSNHGNITFVYTAHDSNNVDNCSFIFNDKLI